MSNISFWRGKRILVGGGCGFLGSYLLPQLVEVGARVLVVDNLSNGYRENIAFIANDIEFVEADLSDFSLCKRLTKNQDLVINLAAKAFGMDYSRSHNGEMLVHNLLSTLTPLEAARLNNVKRFVIVSSSCVYPDNAPIPTPELDVFTGLPEAVNEGYGWAKRIQELAGTYYAKEYGMKVTILRPFNLYGGNYRWRSEEKAHVIPTLVKRILDGEDPLIVWGSGKQRRSFIHGSDAAQLMMRVIEKDLNGVPVNIGYSDDVSISELVKVICELSDKSPKILFDKKKPEGLFRKCSDDRRLKEITDNYIPKVCFKNGINKMIDWYNRSFIK
jgi:nucleoside-diphosphate-sugar epimerase